MSSSEAQAKSDSADGDSADGDAIRDPAKSPLLVKKLSVEVGNNFFG